MAMTMTRLGAGAVLSLIILASLAVDASGACRTCLADFVAASGPLGRRAGAGAAGAGAGSARVAFAGTALSSRIGAGIARPAPPMGMIALRALASLARDAVATTGADDGLTVNEEGGETTTSEDDDEATVAAGEGEGAASESMIAAIRFYKMWISPLLPPACRFLPTCSQYGAQAIKEFGPTKGLILTAWRLARCTPLGGRGYDPPRWPPVPYNYGSY
ncbi:hypothetical protein ACHAWF_011054 [Thalassiosira exigua]